MDLTGWGAGKKGAHFLLASHAPRVAHRGIGVAVQPAARFRRELGKGGWNVRRRAPSGFDSGPRRGLSTSE